MIFQVLFLALFALAAARPYPDDREFVPILRSDVIAPSETREYSFDVRTGDGIVRSESGVGAGESGAVVAQGSFSYTLEDGTPFELKFVADESGYKPESSYLPVALAFPYPIPQFVL